MIRRFLLLLLLGSLSLVGFGAPALAVPNSIDVLCDVKGSGTGRFRSLATGQIQVIFRLWTAETGGSQIGNDYPVAMDKLLVTKLRTQTYDGVRGISFNQIKAVIGDMLNPVQLGSADAYLDVAVGTTTMTCAFSDDKNGLLPPGPPARRKLEAVPFARESSHSETCETCTTTTDISARVYNSSDISIPDSMGTILPLDSERWDTDNIHDATASSNCATVPNRCRLTVQTAGKYLVYASVCWQASSVGVRELYIRTSTNFQLVDDLRPPAAGITTCQSVATHSELNAGDSLEVVVLQTSGGPLSILTPFTGLTAFGMVKLP